MRRITLFHIIYLVVLFVLALSFSVNAENNNEEYLIGDWETSDGMVLSFYDDGFFSLDWGMLGAEEGTWYAESATGDSFVIEMDGSSILSLMSMLYGAAESNYHFEVLKCNENNFYLVQVYGNYTAYSSPCKLGLTRNGAERDFSIPTHTENGEYDESADLPKTISVQDDKGNVFLFQPGEELEDLVLSTESDSYNPRLAYFLAIMARAAYPNKDEHKYLEENLTNLGFNKSDKDYSEDLNNDLTVAYSIAKKEIQDHSEIVMITIRGSYGWSWVTNAAIGIAAQNGFGKHAGFEIDAAQIYNDLKRLVGDITKTDITYVITGHSQGAAAANLLSVMLHDAGVSQSRVYDYNFACPNVACLLNPQDWNPGGADHHNNIFNIGNVEDPVTFLPGNLIKIFPSFNPLSTWGKFGRTYWFYPDSQNQSPVGHDMGHYVNELKKENPISSYVQYSEIGLSYIMRVVGVHCPVDLSVYDSHGVLVAEVVNNEAINHTDSTEIIIIIDGDEKYLCIPTNQTYEIRFVGTDDGTMVYEVSDIDFAQEKVIDEKQFDAVELYKGKELQSNLTKNASVSEINLDSINSPKKDDISKYLFIIGGVIASLIVLFILRNAIKPKRAGKKQNSEDFEDEIYKEDDLYEEDDLYGEDDIYDDLS